MTHPFFLQFNLSSGWSIATGIFGILCLVGAAIIILASRRREEVHLTDKANATALKALLDTRNIELADANRNVTKLREELEATALEFKQLASVDVNALIKADALRRENEALRAENVAIRRERDFWESQANGKAS